MTRITFRSPNYKNGKSITLKGSKLDDSKVYCNQCGVELTQKEIIPSVITFHKYEPSNCAWVTNKANLNHNSKTHFLTYKGKTQSIMQWAEELNINYSTLRNRVNRSGMTVEEALGGKKCQR